MSATIEITKDTLSEFSDIQEAMLIAKEENAVRTYAVLKKRYILLKTLLNAASVNLTAIDVIKE